MMPDIAPGTLVVYSDIGCPWAHLAVHRLHETRARLGLEESVGFDHRAFPLEIFNERPTPKLGLDSEIPVIGGLAPEAGWRLWHRRDHEYPVTTLPALEAVQAAKEQGLRASETLDRALRVALFAESRTISMRHEIRDVARGCDGIDADAVVDALDDGRARPAVLDQHRVAASGGVRGSPHLFLPGGGDAYNPGVDFEWKGPKGSRVLVVNRDDPAVYEELLSAAADSRTGGTMDETSVRESAQDHGDGVVAGDLQRAGAHLTRDAGAKAQDVMRQLPRQIESAQVVRIDAEGEEYVAVIRYSGEGRSVDVASRWAQRGDRAKIVDLRVL